MLFARSNCARSSVFSAADGDGGELERRSKTALRESAGAIFGIEAGEGGGGTGDEEVDGGDESRICGLLADPWMVIGATAVVAYGAILSELVRRQGVTAKQGRRSPSWSRLWSVEKGSSAARLLSREEQSTQSYVSAAPCAAWPSRCTTCVGQ